MYKTQSASVEHKTAQYFDIHKYDHNVHNYVSQWVIDGVESVQSGESSSGKCFGCIFPADIWILDV